jgi:hypothetical protein
MGLLQWKERRRRGWREEGLVAEVRGGCYYCLCSFFIKDLLQGQPACLPQGTPQFPRLCREGVRKRMRRRGGSREEEARWAKQSRAQKERDSTGDTAQ